MKRRLWLWAWPLFVVIFAIACRSGASSPGQTSVPGEAALPTATLAPIPTDDPSVIEPIIAALRSGSAAAVRPYVGYVGSQVSCSVAASQGSPVPTSCSGTPGRVFLLGNCENEYLPPSEMQRALDMMAAMSLYAVYRVPPQFRSAGQYSAVLVDRRPETGGQAWEAIVSNGQIVAFIFSCTLTPQKLIELRHYTDRILLPQTP